MISIIKILKVYVLLKNNQQITQAKPEEKSNIKKNKLGITNVLSPLNATVLIKLIAPSKGKCQFECIVYMVEVYGHVPNDSKGKRNVKKAVCGIHAGLLQK